jgi:hypothetical protein
MSLAGLLKMIRVGDEPRWTSMNGKSQG